MILITAFEPFGGRGTNASARVLERLPETIGGRAVRKLLLPVVFGRAAEEALKPEAECVFLLGEAGGRTGVTPELIARNFRDARIPDNAGNRPSGERIGSGPEIYRTAVPAERIAGRMRSEGYRITVSEDAGTFVCNDTFYLVGTGSAVPVEFIHVPAEPEDEARCAETVRRFIELAAEGTGRRTEPDKEPVKGAMEPMEGKQAINPYLPNWEYVPDGEPHVFGDRVYVYGSHDFFGGDVYCMGDYVCWSAPVNDLADWRYEGVIYRKDQDPRNEDLQGNLYAPDVTRGPDGRYYLYYVLSSRDIVSVAAADRPAGPYGFLGWVRYPDGTLLGEREGDEPQFDPGVLTEGDRTYLYTGFCGYGDKGRHGAMVTVLEADMLTVAEAPRFVAPGVMYGGGTGFEGHEFFEAPSIRKRGEYYYFIYSSIRFHELCYAMSRKPTEGFEYRGVLISSCDMGIGSYKPADRPMYYTANNHGSMERIGEDWYIFYHRHTNGTNYSRQGCLEKLTFREDGTAVQAEMTSCCGIRPLRGEGYYPAYIACHLFTDTEMTYVPWSGWMDDRFPKITQQIEEGGHGIGYIANMRNSATAGFRWFDCRGIRRIAVRTKGYANGQVEVRTAWDGEALGSIPVGYANVWHDTEAEITVPDGVQALYFTFTGRGHLQFAGFELKTE